MPTRDNVCSPKPGNESKRAYTFFTKTGYRAIAVNGIPNNSIFCIAVSKDSMTGISAIFRGKCEATSEVQKILWLWRIWYSTQGSEGRRWELSLISSRQSRPWWREDFSGAKKWKKLKKSLPYVPLRVSVSIWDLGYFLSNSKDVFTQEDQKCVLLRKSALDGAVGRILHCCSWNCGECCHSVRRDLRGWMSTAVMHFHREDLENNYPAHTPSTILPAFVKLG